MAHKHFCQLFCMFQSFSWKFLRERKSFVFDNLAAVEQLEVSSRNGGDKFEAVAAGGLGKFSWVLG
jgi:hypothetical protein